MIERYCRPEMTAVWSDKRRLQWWLEVELAATAVREERGEVPSGTGEIRAAIARHPTHRKRMAVSDGQGREAWTSYRVVERLRHATLLEATLHTGRTHQIRVHFRHLGFPVAGDVTYGSNATQRLASLTGYRAPRVLLHAFRLVLAHPRTGRKKTFTAPCPADFQEALDRLRARV